MHPLQTSKDLDALVDEVMNRPVVMLGEGTHGTHEFYTWRTAISKRLIQEKGFNFIAVEGDWPDCYKINRYVKGYADASDNIEQVLQNFDRWPTWMWGNWEVAALAEWLREYNKTLAPDEKIGFYGLDVYSLWDSLKEMIDYLETKDPQITDWVKKAIQCFEPFNEDEQAYARHTLNENGCRAEVLALLEEIQNNVQFLNDDKEGAFSTEQNALVAVNAEKYYSSMIGFDNESWNVRDRHMMQTLDRLMKFYGAGARGIVWEHNTHIGDARATDMRRAGMLNIGQLAREEYGTENVYLVGFATFKGTVTAGKEWGAKMKVMKVPAARDGSIEADLHKKFGQNCYLLFSEENEFAYTSPIPHRAIGVVYNSSVDRRSNYVPSILNERYNAFVYIDESTALHPLYLHTNRHKLAATYPFTF